jgi:hypothetical protein
MKYVREEYRMETKNTGSEARLLEFMILKNYRISLSLFAPSFFLFSFVKWGK